jgi:uncharacterized DUF497 family protein
MAFEWDPAKRRANLRKHKIDFADAARIFDGLTVEEVDDSMDYGEERILALGETNGRIIVVTYTWRGDVRRIISARKATKHEAAKYRALFS